MATTARRMLKLTPKSPSAQPSLNAITCWTPRTRVLSIPNLLCLTSSCLAGGSSLPAGLLTRLAPICQLSPFLPPLAVTFPKRDPGIKAVGRLGPEPLKPKDRSREVFWWLYVHSPFCLYLLPISGLVTFEVHTSLVWPIPTPQVKCHFLDSRASDYFIRGPTYYLEVHTVCFPLRLPA